MIMMMMTVVSVMMVMMMIEKGGRPDKLNWRGFIQRISRTWAEGESLCSTREKNSKVTKEK